MQREVDGAALRLDHYEALALAVAALHAHHVALAPPPLARVQRALADAHADAVRVQRRAR